VTVDKFADMQELFASLHASLCKGLIHYSVNIFCRMDRHTANWATRQHFL